jgi:uncharacterized protein YecT (DUF1311 family)
MSIEPPVQSPPDRPTFDASRPDLFRAPAPANPWTQPDWRHPTRQQIFLAGLVAAPLFAISLGLMFSPKLDVRRPMQPVTGDPMRIETAGRVAPPPSAASGGKLEILPPDMARAAAANGRPAATALGRPAVVTPASAPVQASDASFACGAGLSASEALVCGNPNLAMADRHMQRAWRRALASGADPERLRRDQRDWLADRDEAAGDGPEAIQALYDERIRDLNDIAENGDGDEPRNN